MRRDSKLLSDSPGTVEGDEVALRFLEREGNDLRAARALCPTASDGGPAACHQH
jgi:hypothetical protein